MKKKYLKWDMVAGALLDLAGSIIDSNFKPDAIIAIGRGGMIPARLLSDLLKVKDVSMISASMYTGIGTRNDKPVIGAVTTNIRDKKVLIVDDIVDSGITVDCVLESMGKYRPDIVKVATVMIKDHVQRLPTYFARTVKEEEWVVFPWETVEFSDE